MKTKPTLLLLASFATALSIFAAEQPAETPAQPENLAPGPTNTPASVEAVPGPATPAILPAPPGADAVTNAPTTNALAARPVSSVVVITNPAALPAGSNSHDGLRLNFRGVPLEMVLNYLSDAAGFIIVLETPVQGKVDVWSNQPLTKDEAVNLLNSVLNKNGYAAIRNGRTLTIVSRDIAKSRAIPVKKGNKSSEIPNNDEIITQIIPIRYINATQVIRDLQPLLPTSAQLSANEAGNALVLTDSQNNIRRMTEIIEALDTTSSAYSSIRVYLLKFADAKAVATVIRDLFQSQDQRSPNDMRAQFFQRMRFGGGFGGPPGGGGEQSSGTPGSGRAPTPKVVATSDERSNALVVSAPEEMVSTIDDLVKAIDTEVEDVTELRAFRLQYADPVEMADLLMGLFPDDSRNTDANRSQVRFGGFGRFSRMQTANSQTQSSDRMKKMGRVLAVPDQRTASVVVSAAHDLMVQIEAMITQLDSNPAKKQKVYVYSLENADVQEVEQLLRDMFDRNGSMNNRNTANQRNALNTRSTQNNQNPNTRNMGMGTSGTGVSRGNFGTGF